MTPTVCISMDLLYYEKPGDSTYKRSSAVFEVALNPTWTSSLELLTFLKNVFPQIHPYGKHYMFYSGRTGQEQPYLQLDGNLEHLVKECSRIYLGCRYWTFKEASHIYKVDGLQRIEKMLILQAEHLKRQDKRIDALAEELNKNNLLMIELLQLLKEPRRIE